MVFILVDPCGGSLMRFVIASQALNTKYGVTPARKIIRKCEDFPGVTELIDASGWSATKLREHLLVGQTKDVPDVLVGGYDVVPTFFRKNPTFGDNDDDRDVPTDAPYAAATRARELAPTGIIARIPDGAPGDAAYLLRVLDLNAAAASQSTPRASFHEAAKEFRGAAAHVASRIPKRYGTPKLWLSPPAAIGKAPDVPKKLSGSGVVHILLHGADYSPDWAYLFGADGTSTDMPKAISARQIDLCDLRGAIVTISSCYAAMLDSGEDDGERRVEANQVAMACLGHGAKCVVASTRSNWIGIAAPFDGFGPGLVGLFFDGLSAGKAAGAALRDAKTAFLKKFLPETEEDDQGYLYKTTLQAQLYGNPLSYSDEAAMKDQEMIELAMKAVPKRLHASAKVKRIGGGVETKANKPGVKGAKKGPKAAPVSASRSLAEELHEELGLAPPKKRADGEAADVEFVEETAIGKRATVVQIRGGKVKQVLKRG